jgi:hypothetical protein
MTGLETQKFSDWKKDRAKESYLWKIAELPILKEVTNVVGNSIQSIVNDTRGSIDNVLNKNKENERITEDAKHEFSRVGGNVTELPRYQAPMGVQRLAGGKTVSGEVKVNSDGRLLNAVYLDEAPCKIETTETAESGLERKVAYQKGEKINRVLEPVITRISNKNRFLDYLTARTGGRKRTGILGLPGLLMKGAKKITRLAGGAGGFAVGALAAGGLLNAGLMALGAPNFMSTVAALTLGGSVTIPGLAAAAVVGFGGLYAGIKLSKFLWKLIPKDKANLLYAARTRGEDLQKNDITQLISKKTGRTLAEHQLNRERGAHVPQEGDLITHIEMPAKKFGIQTLKVVNGKEKMVNGFYSSDGEWHEGSKIVPTGTVIPHGTTWKHNAVVPAGTEYREVQSFTGKELPVGTLEQSIRVNTEGGARLPAMLKLRHAVFLPFGYYDKEHGVQRRAGSLSPAEAIVDVRNIPKGTIIPAGSEIRHEVVSEGVDDINTTEMGEIPTAGLVLPHSTIIRRNINLGTVGVLIPRETQELIDIAGLPPVSIGDLPGSEETHDGRSYKRFQFPNGILPAGSRMPSGTILPPRAKLDMHGGGSALPVGARISSDMECMRDISLASTADYAGIDRNNFRLQISDRIDADDNELPTFQDPETSRIINEGHEIPAGTTIPAFQHERGGFFRRRRKAMVIPRGFVIPGGSVAYDVNRRPTTETPEVAGRVVTAALASIRSYDMSTVDPGNYRNWILQRPEVVQALEISVGTPMEERIMNAIETKIVDTVRGDLAGFGNTIASNNFNPNPIHRGRGHDYVDRMMTAYGNSGVDAGIQQISDYETQERMTQAAHRTIINRIGANINQMIAVQLRNRFPAPPAGANPAARERTLRQTQEVRTIIAVIGQLDDGRLANQVITEGRQMQQNYTASLDGEIQQICA